MTDIAQDDGLTKWVTRITNTFLGHPRTLEVLTTDGTREVNLDYALLGLLTKIGAINSLQLSILQGYFSQDLIAPPAHMEVEYHNADKILKFTNDETGREFVTLFDSLKSSQQHQPLNSFDASYNPQTKELDIVKKDSVFDDLPFNQKRNIADSTVVQRLTMTQKYIKPGHLLTLKEKTHSAITNFAKNPNHQKNYDDLNSVMNTDGNQPIKPHSAS